MTSKQTLEKRVVAHDNGVNNLHTRHNSNFGTRHEKLAQDLRRAAVFVLIFQHSMLIAL